MVNAVRMVLEANPTFVCVKCDIRNAHNEVARAAIVEELEEQATLRHLAWQLDYLSPPEPRKSPEKKKSSGQKISKLKTQVKSYPIPKQSHFRAKHPKNRRVLVRKL